MEDDESSYAMSIQSRSRKSMDGGAMDAAQLQRLKLKQNVCDKVLKHLREAGAEGVEDPSFAEELEEHFKRLPTRYALDVNTDRAEDVLTHKRLLEEARSPESSLAFYVRPVHFLPPSDDNDKGTEEGVGESPGVEGNKYSTAAQSAMKSRNFQPPAFGSNPSLENLAINIPSGEEREMSVSSQQAISPRYPHLPMHELTFSTRDKPKLLSQLSSVLADVGLNIREAHVFSTADGYSLDVFVVDGWSSEETENLMSCLQTALNSMENATWARSGQVSPLQSPAHTPTLSQPSGVPQVASADPPRVPIPSDGQDDWEIDSSQLILQNKIASGSFGDLYRGTYCGQDVAIKILKQERLNENLQQEFAQEVFIMRKIRHKNVVQFIGACTKPPNLSIVTEYMSGGSVYDWLHRQKAPLRPAVVLRIALDVARGMDFLHKNSIIHRDLKAANLLMNENEVVKVADFGVARVQAHTGIMTAETGTYRWMAPEVIEHRPYTHKADVYSFGVVMWELITGKLPYADLTPLQAAVNVVQKNLRPHIPRVTPPGVASLMERCWSTNPVLRPEFSEVVKEVQALLVEAEKDDEMEVLDKKDKKKGGFFSSLKKK